MFFFATGCRYRGHCDNPNCTRLFLFDLLWNIISKVTENVLVVKTFILLILLRVTSMYSQLIQPIYGIHKLLNIPVQFERHNSNLLHSNLP